MLVNVAAFGQRPAETSAKPPPEVGTDQIRAKPSMALAIAYSRALIGIEARSVVVEIHLSSSMPAFTIVGLPETAVRESKDRVRSALLTSGYRMPERRITVNLAPADTPKVGCRFDLAIAIGILAASGQLPVQPLAAYEFLGELALGGQLRPIPGALPAARAAARAERALILPSVCAPEAALAPGAEVLGADHLLDVCAHLCGVQALSRAQPIQPPGGRRSNLRLSDVRGQTVAKRALVIAAAGGHNLLMSGPPGAGKTMLAERLPGLLPPLTDAESMDVASLYSASGRRDHAGQRPFRAPHHTASVAAIIGGGQTPSPGEISLAHRGVLFLDELPEFSRAVLESLREPLESGQVEVARARYRVLFPACFQLVAAMNPCPAGRACNAEQMDCRCSPEIRKRYRNRLSQPLTDRIDMQIYVEQPQHGVLFQAIDQQDDDAIQAKVWQARDLALQRAGKTNQFLSVREIERYCALSKEDRSFFVHAAERLQLTLRGCHRVLRVARTLADLAGELSIRREHLREALAFRLATRGD